MEKKNKRAEEKQKAKQKLPTSGTNPAAAVVEKRAHKARTEKPLVVVKKTARPTSGRWDATSCCNAGTREATEWGKG